MSAAVVQPAHTIQRSDLILQKSGKYLYSDNAAAMIAMRDMDTWDSYVMQQNWAARWIDSDTLYQSPQSMSPWGQGVGTRTSVPNFLLSNTLDVVVPKIVGGMTYEDPPFLLRPRPGTSTEVIRAKTAIFSFQLEDMNFVETVEESVFDMGLRGTCILKWGWHEEKRKARTFKRKAEPEVITSPGTGFKTTVHTEETEEIDFELVERTVRRPYLEFKDLSRVGFDPALKTCDIRKSKWTVERNFADWEDLELLRTLPDYEIPSKEVLLEWFLKEKKPASPDNQTMTIPEGMKAYIQHATSKAYPTSADPLRASLEIIERQDCNSIICVLRHGTDCVLIRNSENPFAEIAQMAGGTGHTYLSCVWRRIRDSGYGQGLGQIVGSRQMVAQGTENMALEVLAYPLQPTFTRVRGWNSLTQNLRLGTGDVLDVDGDDVRKAIGLLEMPRVPAEAWQTLSYNKNESLESAGVNQQVTMGAGAPGIQTTGMRSGSGAQLVGRAAASRLDGPVERYIRQVFTPFLFIMDALNNQLLPTQNIREILTEREASDLQFDHVKYRNSKMKFEVLAGAHLGPKQEMTQFLSLIEQIAINPALLEAAGEADMAFNFRDWFRTFAEMSGFKFSQQFFVDMSPQQKQRRDQNSKAGLMARQTAAAQQQEAQSAAQKTREIFDKSLARAGERVTVLQAEHALQLGQPTFGTETVG